MSATETVAVGVHGSRPSEPREALGSDDSGYQEATEETRSVPADADELRNVSAVYVFRLALFSAGVVVLGISLNVVVGSRFEERAAQKQAFDRLRQELALGTAPIGPRTGKSGALSLGTPIALLQVPSIGLEQVVEEGTTGAILMSGPGHLRSTPFPGGVGTSVILGRAASYGGPFSRIASLRKGARILVTTAVGKSTFEVDDRRSAGDVVPPLGTGQARLTLATASGPSFLPSGVVWVDASLVGTPLPAQRPLSTKVPADEQPLASDTGHVGVLFLWSVALALVIGIALRSWHKRGHAWSWIVFTAPIILISYFLGGQVSLLLPNLM